MIRIYQELCSLGGALISQLRLALPHRSQPLVPECEEWLAEVCLDTPTLVVDVMVRRIVAGDVLHWVPWKGVSRVIIDGLDGASREECDAKSW
jgi:hypothetical protein